MKTFYFLVTILATFSFLSSGGSLWASEPDIPQYLAQNQYPKDFIHKYLQDCSKRAIAEGVPPEDTNTFCQCTIKQFQSLYPLAEFEQLTKDSKTNEVAAEKLADVGYNCLEEILYEE